MPTGDASYNLSKKERMVEFGWVSENEILSSIALLEA
jgi:hypothetical protein